MDKVRKKLLDAARLLIIAAIFWFLYSSGRLNLASIGEAATHPGAIVSATALLLIGMLISVERWRLLIKAQDIHVGLWPALNLTLIGAFFNIVFPGAVGGDIVKAYYLAKGQQQKAALVTTVIFDRLLGLYTVIFVAALAGLGAYAYVATLPSVPPWWTPAMKGLVLFVLVFFAAYNIAGAVVMSKRLRKTRLNVFILTKMPFHDKVVKIYNSIHGFRDRPLYSLAALGLSIVSQFMMYTALYIIAQALDINELSPGHYMFALPLCILINAIPLAPGGLGVGEIGFGEILSLFGSAKGVELAVVFHIISMVLAVALGGVAYMAYGKGEQEIKSATGDN
ncbi:MAG: flippase-like domain-containing protein [Nitrospinae bacterium]|nr:flippase-like domain-containing protein [Nitrospinota bacterium]